MPSVTGYRDAKISESYGLAQASGAQWYTGDLKNIIGKIKTSGAITDYSCPCSGGTISVPYGITLGPDANIWFADHNDGSLGADYIGSLRISKSMTISPVAGPSGTTITVYGDGFSANEAVDVDYDSSSNTQICSGVGHQYRNF